MIRRYYCLASGGVSTPPVYTTVYVRGYFIGGTLYVELRTASGSGGALTSVSCNINVEFFWSGQNYVGGGSSTTIPIAAGTSTGNALADPFGNITSINTLEVSPGSCGNTNLSPNIT